MHPVPDMQNHLIKFGIRDFEFIPEIEKAIIVPEKETRKKFKSSKSENADQ